MLSYAKKIVSRVETEATLDSRENTIRLLGELGLDDFGELLLTMPNREYPRISAQLPAMVSDDVQKNWTGSSGIPLLRQTCTFVRAVCNGYVTLTGKPFKDRRLLDFGCGYGRIARAMLYYSKPSLIWGVDPWPYPIRLCHAHGLGDQFLQCEELPTSLPVSGSFDVIYAYSVFTHLSQKACLNALRVLRNYICDDGILAMTIRPLEFWSFRSQGKADMDGTIDRLMRHHELEGFAFDPHDRKPIDGDITYGDTSMTLDWIRSNAKGWRLSQIDRSLEDPFQINVFLTPERSPRS